MDGVDLITELCPRWVHQVYSSRACIRRWVGLLARAARLLRELASQVRFQCFGEGWAPPPPAGLPHIIHNVNSRVLCQAVIRRSRRSPQAATMVNNSNPHQAKKDMVAVKLRLLFSGLPCPLLDWEVKYVCANKRVSGQKG